MKKFFMLLALLPFIALGQIDKMKDKAVVTVSTGYDASATSVTLSSGDGSKLLDPSVDGEFYLVWYNNTTYPDAISDPNWEVVRVTARSSDVLTVVRAQAGTSATTKNTASKTYKMFQTILAVNWNAIGDSAVLYSGTSGYAVRDSAGRLVADSKNRVPLFGVTLDSSYIQTGLKILVGWYTSVTVNIDTLCVLNYGGSSPSITPDIHFGSDVSAAGTALITTPSAVTTVTTVNKVSTFNNAQIPAGNIIWIEFDAKSGIDGTSQALIVLIGRKVYP